MNKAQFQAYQELVNKLLKCPSGKEQEILTTYQNLLNKDLIAVMKNTVVKLKAQGKQNDAFWLESFAAMLSGFIKTFQNKSSEEYLASLTQVLQAYDDKMLETQPQSQTFNEKLNKLSAKALRSWGKVTLDLAKSNWQLSCRIGLTIENRCNRALQVYQSNKDSYQLEVAIAGYEIILPIFQNTYESQKSAKIKANLGYAYSRRILGNRAKNLEKAIRYLNEALIQYEELYNIEECSFILSKIQNSLGYAHRNSIYGDISNHLEKAIRCYTEALTLDISEYLPEDKAEIYISLGICYRKRICGDKEENLRKAIKFYEQALNICLCDQYSEKWARIQHALGKAYYSIGIIYFYNFSKNKVDNFSIAIEYYYKSLQIRTFENNPTEWARVQHSLGDAYRDKEYTIGKVNNFIKAINCYLNALKVYTYENHPYEWAQVNKSLGNAYRKLARNNKFANCGDVLANLNAAISCHKKSLAVLTKRRFPNEFADVSFYLARDYYDAGNMLESYENFKHAIETVELLRDEIISSDDIKQKFAENWNKLYRCMVEVCIDLEKYIEAIEYVEGSKTRSLFELLVNRDVENLFSQEQLREIQKINEEITKLQYTIQQTNYFKDTDEIKLKNLRYRRDELQNQIIGFNDNFEFRKFHSRFQDSDCAIVEFYITQQRFIVFIITSTKPEPTVLSFTQPDLNTLNSVAKFYFSAYEQQKEHWQNELLTYLNQLSHCLHLDEIIEQIPNNCKTLILIPHQYLHLLPLHALPLKVLSQQQENQTLMEYFTGGVFYIPSCQLYQLVKQRLNAQFHSLFAIQTPTSDLYEQDLGAIGAIKKQFKDVYILKNDKAKKSAIIYLNRKTQTLQVHDKLKKADFILFFCHGKFEPTSPLKSRLQLADDNLTLADIISINFQLKWGSLVTLAACETGLTSRLDIGVEYISLSYGFLLARSSNVISSLWTVSTSATALLIIRFYELLKTENQIAVALNKAQLWLYKSTVTDFQKWLQQSLLISDTWKITLNKEFNDIKNQTGANARPFESPYYWAPFRLIGKGESPMSVYESAILSFIDVIKTQCNVSTKDYQDELKELLVDLPEEDEDIVEKIEAWLKVESRNEFLQAYREHLNAKVDSKNNPIDLEQPIEMPAGGKGYDSNKKPKSQARELLVIAVHELTDNKPNSSEKKS